MVFEGSILYVHVMTRDQVGCLFLCLLPIIAFISFTIYDFFPFLVDYLSYLTLYVFFPIYLFGFIYHRSICMSIYFSHLACLEYFHA